MKRNHDDLGIEAVRLRRQAEEKMVCNETEKERPRTPRETEKLLRELEVHRIELEMQNEELRQAQTEQWLDLERYTELFNFAPIGYFKLDQNGVIVQANLAGASLLGVGHSQLLARRLALFICEEDRLMFRDSLTKAMTGTLTSWDTAIQTERNEKRFVQISAISTDVGKECRLVMTDITERKLVEEELRKNKILLDRQNLLFSTLIESLPVGVFMVEAPSGKPLVANAAAFKLLGRGILPDANENSIGEVYEAYRVGTNVLYPPAEMPILMGISGKHSYVDDMEVVRPDGTKIVMEVYGSPVFDEQGINWASVVNFADISERKRAEELLRQSKQRLQKELNTAGKFQRFLIPDGGNFPKADIAIVYQPLEDTGGDFLNYRWVTDSMLRGYVADIKGHGMSAALHTTAVNLILCEQYNEKCSTDILNVLNEKVLRYFEEDSFVAVLLFEFDFSTNILTLSCGGINSVLSSREPDDVLHIWGSFAGLVPEPEFNTVQQPFETGDVFVFATDGIFDMLPQYPRIPLKKFDRTVKTIQKLSEATERWDDCTAVCIAVK